MTPTRWLCLFVLVAACDDPPALPELTAVPDFALVDHHGQAFGSDDLDGHVWIANFIFTTCPSVCPLLTTQMGNLESHLTGENLRFVSFTVDPERDTPEVLAAYALAHGAESERWSFLTGDADAVRAAVTEGLRMRMGTRDEATGDIMHGSHFVLVDGRGTIRGFYSSDGDGIANLERDTERLLNP